MELIFGLILLVLNIWAIFRTIGSGATVGVKIAWVLLIIFLPLIGFILWLIFGPKDRRSTI